MNIESWLRRGRTRLALAVGAVAILLIAGGVWYFAGDSTPDVVRVEMSAYLYDTDSDPAVVTFDDDGTPYAGELGNAGCTAGGSFAEVGAGAQFTLQNAVDRRRYTADLRGGGNEVDPSGSGIPGERGCVFQLVFAAVVLDGSTFSLAGPAGINVTIDPGLFSEPRDVYSEPNRTLLVSTLDVDLVTRTALSLDASTG